MTIHTCDICGKEIPKDEEGRVWAGKGSSPFGAQEFCASCGKPVVLFLKRVEKMKDVKKTAHP